MYWLISWVKDQRRQESWDSHYGIVVWRENLGRNLQNWKQMFFFFFFKHRQLVHYNHSSSERKRGVPLRFNLQFFIHRKEGNHVQRARGKAVWHTDDSLQWIDSNHLVTLSEKKVFFHNIHMLPKSFFAGWIYF